MATSLKVQSAVLWLTMNFTVCFPKERPEWQLVRRTPMEPHNQAQENRLTHLCTCITDHRFGRRALGFVSKSVPPGLSPSRFECTATCSARELWRSRVDQFGCGGSTAAADLYIVLEDRNGLQGTRLRPQLACARICLEWCKYDVAQW